jgi:hypothetical protein
VLQEAWEMYKAHLVHFAGIAAVIWVGVAILQALLVETGNVMAVILGSLVSTIGLFLVQAALVRAVQDVRDGKVDLSIGQTFSAAAPYLARVSIAGILAGLGIALGLVLLIVPGLILLTWWVLVPPVIVVENSGTMDAFGRSKDLVRGYGWEVFGIIVLTYVVLIAVSILIDLILVPLDDWLASLLSNLISGIAISPFVTVAWTLLYFRMVEAKAGTGPSTAPPTV